MLIRDLESQTGLERATIRFYEKEGLITPERQENGYRIYSEGDCDTLLKVKLLRQLGMPLEKIKGLQQGSEDFSAALAEQIEVLEKQIQDASRAKEVCAQIKDTGASYETLDAAHYLRELAHPAQPVPEFRRITPTHPWRRFFAREIDFLLFDLLRVFLLVVVLRIRPINSALYTLTNLWIVVRLLWIPVEGVLLHYFGTTPGKWIMGIRVESVNGGHLTISGAMHRAWTVLWNGYGLGIPILNLWRWYRCAKDYGDLGYTQWDYDCGAEIQFTYYYDGKKKALIAGIAALFMVGFGFCMNDSIKPVNRGVDLTVAQFAENYNDLIDDLYENQKAETTIHLRENGKWMANTYSANTIVVGSKEVGGISNLQYELEGDFVRQITYEQSWEDIFMLSPLGFRPMCVALSVATAQDWMDLRQYYEFAERLEKEMKQSEGTIRYENLEIVWAVTSVGCRESGGVYYAENENADSSVNLEFAIIIHDTP